MNDRELLEAVQRARHELIDASAALARAQIAVGRSLRRYAGSADAVPVRARGLNPEVVR